MVERIVPACPAGHIDTPFVIEVRGVYDGGLIFECPVCQARWPRFSEGRLHRAALKIIEEWGGSIPAVQGTYQAGYAAAMNDILRALEGANDD